MTLPAITIRQPWARCVASGHKTVENRGRATHYRGPMAIHAGRAPDLSGDRDLRVLHLWGPDARIGAPVGAVLAVADLVDCHQAGECVNADCRPWGDAFYPGRSGPGPAWHLVFADIRQLARPVYTRGYVQVGWPLTDEVEAAVRAELSQQGVTL